MLNVSTVASKPHDSELYSPNTTTCSNFPNIYYGKNALKGSLPSNVMEFPSQNEKPVNASKNNGNNVETEYTQLSIFVQDSTDLMAYDAYDITPTKHQKVLPIKTPDVCKQVYNSLLKSGRYGKRNASIFALNLAIGRRSSDVLKLKVSDVYDYTTNSIRTKITIKESKTGKMAIGLPLDKYTQTIIESYIHSLKNKSPQAYLFPSQKKNPDGTQRPINVTSLNEILKANTEAICKTLGDPDQTHFSSYVARKTFGYRLYKHYTEKSNGIMWNGIHVLDFLQAVYNHSSRKDTLRYIGAWEDLHEEAINDIAEEWSAAMFNTTETNFLQTNFFED